MKITDYAGINYGFGSNYDRETGISFGVCYANELPNWDWESDVDEEFGRHCPHCGDELTDEEPEDDHPVLDFEDDEDEDEGDERCPSCHRMFWRDDSHDESPSSSTLTGEYEGFVTGDDHTIFVTKSPYFTYCQYCSPCMPGAGNLANFCDKGPATYCFGPDMFDEQPYPIFSVETGEQVNDFDLWLHYALNVWTNIAG